ncbi:enoyl-CoA hydratase/isomerase family protein [Flavobacterium sp. TMP13]|uniref:enoyl-CoA hydratase/isomerase family protein n=1 Tax=Flavobacterium sp. TMP13 TaxID=3425950 RepID=UPI003D76F15F
MSTVISKGSLHSKIDNTIATVTFGHPASNSFPSDLLQRLTAEINHLNGNSLVNVIILKSEGNKAFCAGASFEELLAVTNESEGKSFFSGFAHLINAMKSCSKIIVASVQGKAVGGGVGIVAACDYAFATEDSSIKLSELAIGIGPFVIEPVLSHKIGKTAMAQMTLNAQQWQTATWAQQKGLFATVVTTPEELITAVTAFARSIASYNPEALAQMKKIIWEGTENWDKLLIARAEISGKLVLSDFTKNALLQFKKQ